MIRIAFCEDEKPQSEYIVGLIKAFGKKHHKTFTIDTYTSAEQFLFSREDEAPYDLYILDIQLGRMNGMELARQIREQDKDVRIVFLTGLKDYAIEGYEVGAVRYLLKPVQKEILYELLETLSGEIETNERNYFLFHASGQTRRIPFSDIYYLEADGHYVNIRTSQGDNRWKASLSSIVPEFEKNNFVMTYRGLYVNLAHIERIGRAQCYLDNGETLPVSKTRYQALNQAFIEYYRYSDEGGFL